MQIRLWIFCGSFGKKYSRMDQVKFVEDSLQKRWRDMVCLSRSYHFKFSKGCLPQILLGPFLNTLSHFFGTHWTLATLKTAFFFIVLTTLYDSYKNFAFLLMEYWFSSSANTILGHVLWLVKENNFRKLF